MKMFSPMGMSIGAAINHKNCYLLEAVLAILDLEIGAIQYGYTQS